VPEFLFEAATAENVSASALGLLSSENHPQKQALKDAMIALGKGQKGTELWAARSVLRFLDQR